MTSQVPSHFRNNPKLLNSLWQLLLHEIGGLRMIELLYRHHVEGVSLRRLADMEQLAVGTLRGRLTKAKNVLDRIDLWPEAWGDSTLKQHDPHEQTVEGFEVLSDSKSSRHSGRINPAVQLRTEDESEDMASSPVFKKWVRALNVAR